MSGTKSCPMEGNCALARCPNTRTTHVLVYSHDRAGTPRRAPRPVQMSFTVWVRYELVTPGMTCLAVTSYCRDSLYNTLFRTRLPSAVTSFWTGQIPKEHRTHTVNSILKSAHSLVTLLRAFWHEKCRVTICRLPYSLVVGQDYLYTSTTNLDVQFKISFGISTIFYPN